MQVRPKRMATAMLRRSIDHPPFRRMRGTFPPTGPRAASIPAGRGELSAPRIR